MEKKDEPPDDTRDFMDYDYNPKKELLELEIIANKIQLGYVERRLESLSAVKKVTESAKAVYESGATCHKGMENIRREIDDTIFPFAFFCGLFCVLMGILWLLP